jgi:chorismate mutase/prephenate dehydratase
MALTPLRKKIDELDTKIVSLLSRRAELSMFIGREKLKNKKGVYAPDRETEVFKRIKALNKGPMKPEAFEAIYREIMSSSLSLEKPLNIACLGTDGSFTSVAANDIFGSQVSYKPCNSILDVFREVEHDDCDYGVVPIENSVEGAVTHTLDLLVDSDLKICRQKVMPISHNLLARKRNTKIKKIYSNPQVFGQCRNWLLQHMPSAGLIGVESTTQAAKMATKENNAAAIASTRAAKVYNLRVINRNVQDVAHNTTRFLVISKEDVPPTGKDRTSILFSIKDKVGALHDMLVPFSKYNINLTKIESRPSKKRAWDYYFFVDFDGHRLDGNVQKALTQLEGKCKYLKILGSYPALE